MHIDMSSLAAVQHTRNTITIVIDDISQNSRANCIKIPYIMCDVLEVANILTSIQIYGDQGVRVKVVPRPQRAIEVGRRVTGYEIGPIVGQINRWVLPDATT